MALPSQSDSSVNDRRLMSSSRRKPRWRLLLLLVVVVLVLLWLFNPWSGTDEAAAPEPAPTPNPPAAVTPPPAAPTPAPAPTPQPEPEPEPEPVVVAPPPAPAPVPAPEPEPSKTVNNDPVAARLAEGAQLIDQGKLVEARRVLSALLVGDLPLGQDEQRIVRDKLTQINDHLFFSKRIVADDPLVESYIVKAGDQLSKIARPLKVPYGLIMRINGISDARRIRVGQKLKLVRGPLHAIVDKSDYRMDIFAIGPQDQPLYLRSFPVGLGEQDSTPLGRFVVRANSKLENPSWVDPRTGKQYDREDPNIPIGEYWIGLRGVDPETEGLSGYGLHGTNVPESVGQQQSMGCVRLRADDIKLLFDMLVEDESTVIIRP